mgnify:CR=1 FL=1
MSDEPVTEVVGGYETSEASCCGSVDLERCAPSSSPLAPDVGMTATATPQRFAALRGHVSPLLAWARATKRVLCHVSHIINAC